MILIRKGYKYQLPRTLRIKTPLRGWEVETPFVRLAEDGTLAILAGYAWDGASGPTLDTPATQLAALIHDALYQLARHFKIPRFKRYADAMLEEVMRANGANRMRARAWRWVVEKMGKPAPRKETVIPAELPVGWSWDVGPIDTEADGACSCK